MAFQMPVRSMTLTTEGYGITQFRHVSDACQINDFDHNIMLALIRHYVSDACQINDFDHDTLCLFGRLCVSDACQINDFDHSRR